MIKTQSLSVKQILGATIASLALVLGLAAGSASAQVDCTTGSGGGDNNCANFPITDNTDNSVHLTASGDCSAVQVNGGSQTQNNNTEQGNLNIPVDVNLQDDDNVNTSSSYNEQSNSNSTSQSQVGNSYNADCSTTNVLGVSQVKAPKGGVNAGAESSLGAVAAFAGSLSALAGGLALRRFEV